MATLETGEIIDNKYQVGKLIGEGAMGAVYEGEHLRISRRVAIKVLHAAAARQPEVRARFEKEAHAVARIKSEHICDVLDVGDLPDGGAYLVMELLDGEDLDGRIKERGKLSSDDAALIAYQLLDGLATMHAAGIVHRDLKPANLFLARTPHGGENVKILDFGVSKFEPKQGDGSVTATGVVMGTPFYMSPEQARGDKSVDHRSDLYSVGVILYEAVTGRLPFTGSNFQEIFFKIVLETAPGVEEVEPSADPKLAQIIRKAMSREPAERYQSAAELQDAIGAFAASRGLALNPAHSISPGAPEAPPASVGLRADAPTSAEPVAPKGRGVLVGIVATLVVASVVIAISLWPAPPAAPAVADEPAPSASQAVASAVAVTPPAASSVVMHTDISAPALTRAAAPAPGSVAIPAGAAVASADASVRSSTDASSAADASPGGGWGMIAPTVPTTTP